MNAYTWVETDYDALRLVTVLAWNITEARALAVAEIDRRIAAETGWHDTVLADLRVTVRTDDEPMIARPGCAVVG
jgi:hypothetical protein